MKKNTMNIVNVNSLDSMLSAENTLYKFNDMYINVYRVKNDINGNPLYHISFYNEREENITKNYRGKIGRYYSKKGYITAQSYNISNTIEYILNK
jgi:hypothetical protein